MNILYICNVDINDTHGNGQRTRFMLDALQNLGTVYTVGIVGNKTFKKQEHYWTIHHPFFGVYGWRGILYKIHKYLLDKFYYLDFGWFRYPLEYDIHTLTGVEHFDLVVCRYVDNAAYYHLWKLGPLFIDYDDHPMQLLETDMLSHKYGNKKLITKFITKLQLRIIESKIKGGWIANGSQIAWFHNQAKIRELPNIPRKPSSTYDFNKQERKNYIFTIGLMWYKPNHEGVDKFLAEVWPKVHKMYPDLKYLIGGKNAPENMFDKWSRIEGVECLGYVDDLEKLYEESLASVVPIDTGSGTCIKTIESLSYSRVCIATPFGARGLENKEGIGVFLYSNAEEFIACLSNVIFDKNKRKEAEASAKSFVDKAFSFDRFSECVADLIRRYETKRKVL